jgi:hypothetical protein
VLPYGFLRIAEILQNIRNVLVMGAVVSKAERGLREESGVRRIAGGGRSGPGGMNRQGGGRLVCEPAVLPVPESSPSGWLTVAMTMRTWPLLRSVRSAAGGSAYSVGFEGGIVLVLASMSKMTSSALLWSFSKSLRR